MRVPVFFESTQLLTLNTAVQNFPFVCLALYGEAEDMQELEYPRAKSSRQLPKALKQKLAARASILYPELLATLNIDS